MTTRALNGCTLAVVPAVLPGEIHLNKIKSQDVIVVMSPWWQQKWPVEFICDDSGIQNGINYADCRLTKKGKCNVDNVILGILRTEEP